MTTFTVYYPPADDAGSSTDRFRLVPDSKSVLALVVPPVWLAWHQLWLELLAYLLVVACIVLIGIWQPVPAVSYIWALPGFYLLLEGHELVCRRLERQGWHYAGTVEGENRDEAELRFAMQAAEAGRQVAAAPSAPRPAAAVPAAASHRPLGLFPE